MVKIFGTFDEDSLTDEEYAKKHPIMERKLVNTRRIAGIIAGAAVAIGFYALAPNTMNVDIVGATAVGIGSALVSHGLIKQRQKKKIGLKKHSIVKRVLYGKDENRPTAVDRVALVAAIAPTAITFITGASAGLIPMIAGISAYLGKRVYNHMKYKKENNTESMTR